MVEFDASGRILDIEEKPARPRSSIAGSGLQVYDNGAVDSAFHLKPCSRVELEITDVNEAYLNRGNLRLQVFLGGVTRLDTGTHNPLLKASTFIETIENRQGLKIAGIEEIEHRPGFIDAGQPRRLAYPMKKNVYGQYLLKILSA